MFIIDASKYAPIDPIVPPCDIAPIFIGYVGENLARCVTFDLTDCYEQFGEGSFTISFIRDGDTQPYLVAHTDELDGVAMWNVDSTDTAVKGYGVVQVLFIKDGVTCKSALYRTVTFDSNGVNGDAPDPYENILDQIAAYATQAQASASAAASSAAQAAIDVAEAIAPMQAQLDEAIAGVTVDSEVINARVDENGTAYQTLGQRLNTEFSDVKNEINEIWSEQIVGMKAENGLQNSPNIFKYAELLGTGKAIYSIANGKVTLTDNASYDTYLINVDGNSTYTFTNCRSAVVVSDRNLTAVGSIITYATSIASTGGKYIVFSFNPTTYSTASYEITKPIHTYKIPSNWDISDKKIITQQIKGMLATGKNVISDNIFGEATLVASGKYVDRIEDGKAVLSNNASYDTYIIPVNGVDTYTFTNVRTGALVSDLEYTAVGSLIANATDIASTGGAYILFSFNPTTYPPESFSVTHPLPQYEIPVNWKLRSSKTPIQTKTAASIASGGSIALTGKTAIKYGYQLVFKCFLTAFSEIKLAYYNYNNASISNSIVVDATNIVIYVGTTAVDTFAHGLTIINDFTLIVDYKRSGVEITLESDGTKYVASSTFEKLTSGVVSPTIVSNGTTATNAVFRMIVARAKKDIWYFGDSYISFSNPARWAYYLCDYDYDENTLLNGYAGGTSATTVMALTALLNYGTPKIAVFATGMNDGSDSSSAPSTSWANARDSFISLCEANGIEIIFATVPTVPSVNNEQKNAWVKSSGYRYIDFAKAVGADGTGAWYSGMLSTDNVHPTEKGAIALFTQALADVPEFLT